MSALEALAGRLQRFGEVRRDEQMWKHTTFGIGGPADVYAIIRDAEGLKAAACLAADLQVPWFVLGSGSNIVVADGGIRGLVIDNRAKQEETIAAGAFRLGSGVSFAAFARKACRKGIGGLTWAVGIPGTIGGAVVYNAGAYGGCLADVLTRARLAIGDADAWFDAKELGLVYRGSTLRERQGGIVLEAEVALETEPVDELLTRVADFDRRRLNAQPRGRNAGSMFKNPPDHPAWKLIDVVGLRGARKGDAGISEQHSNFFVNHGSARAADVNWLVAEAEGRVKAHFGIELQREVAFVGGLVMARQRVVVLFGGRSGEHEVSVTSARGVMAALDSARWEVVPMAIGRSGRWLSAEETAAGLAAGVPAFEGGADLLVAREALATLAGCDVVFPLVHGTYGEDGTLQGLLEMAGLAYAGPGVAASAIGLDKAIMKALFREAGIPVTEYGVLREWEVEEGSTAVDRYIESTVGYPCFVKPANGGSSVGVSRATSREDMAAAIRAALAYDDKVVVERAVQGREVEVSVLGNRDPQASVVGEVVPDREFYDYDSKYATDSKTRLEIPANIPAATADRIRELGIRMYQVMGCEGYARVDFFLCAGGEIVANEVNTIPGFTSISMYPKLWEASGLGYSDLLTRILELGIERHARRSRR